MKIKFLTTSILSSLLFLSPLSSMAGEGEGKVIQIMVHVNDVVFFELEGGHINRPACSATPWSISLATHTGRAMYAMLLSAQVQGQKVNVFGTGDCSAWSDRETAKYILINK
jgi:hypothetical protein